MFCGNCGTNIGDMGYCPNCGMASEPLQQNRQKKSHRGLIAVISIGIIAVVVCIIVAVVIVMQKKKDNKEEAKKTLEHFYSDGISRELKGNMDFDFVKSYLPDDLYREMLTMYNVSESELRQEFYSEMAEDDEYDEENDINVRFDIGKVISDKKYGKSDNYRFVYNDGGYTEIDGDGNRNYISGEDTILIDKKHKVSEVIIFEISLTESASNGNSRTITLSSIDEYYGMIYCYDGKWYPGLMVEMVFEMLENIGEEGW